VTVDALADYPRTVVLTDGLHVVLRPMSSGDADRLGALRTRLELGARDRLSADAGHAVVLAWDGERVAAAAVLERRGEAGAVHIAIDPAYGGRRLGTWMLLDLVHLGAAMGFGALEAAVPAADAPYHEALRRLDFVEDRERSSPAEAVLVKTLHASWPDF
jgi:GNAT superfamily N-acetyltransferase